MPAINIDELYAGFCESVPCEIQPVALNFAHRLGLARAPGVPWSEVFAHEVTLAAPALIAEALPRVGDRALHLAVLAHMLAVIEAFGTDRLVDGQVVADPALSGVLACVRAGRDHALQLLDPSASYHDADVRSRMAMARERALLVGREAMGFDTYTELSLDKQAVGFAASLSLARASGASARQVKTLESLLADIWLGLQYYDDVVDWEDDWSRGGAWVASLAWSTTRMERDGFGGNCDHIRPLVLDSGVLATVLDRARRRFRAAAARSLALGATGLAAWAEERRRVVSDVWRAELRSPGFAVRRLRLTPVAAELLG